MKRRVFLTRASLLGVPLLGTTAATASETRAGVTPADENYPVGDVRRYGAAGDGRTDDSAAIQRAVNASQTVHFPAGNYLCRKKIDLRSGSSLIGDGSATLRTDGHSYILSAVGKLGSRQAIRRSVARGDPQIAVASGTANAYRDAGGYFLQSDKPPLGHPTHRSGEIGAISGAGPNTVTVRGGILDEYQISDQAKAAPLTFVDGITIRGLNLSNDNYHKDPSRVTSALIYLEFVNNFRISDCSILENNSAGIALFSCMNGSINNNAIGRLRDGRGGILGYGVQIGYNSHSVTISSNAFYECRHAVTTGTGTRSGRTPNYGVSRGLAIVGNSVSDCTNTALDTHEDSDGITISGNTVVSSTVGIHVRSYGSTITGNTVSACRGRGIKISKTAQSTIVTGNIVRRIRRRSSIGDGIVIDSSSVTVTGNQVVECDRHGISVEGNAGSDITLTGNTCRNNGQAMPGDGINIDRKGPISQLTLTGNSCSDDQPKRTQRFNFSIEAGTQLSQANCLVAENNFAASGTAGIRHLGSGDFRSGGNLGGDTIGTIRTGSTTNSVAGSLMFRISGSGMISELRNGAVGQEIRLVAENTATIVNSGSIRLQGNRNYVMQRGDTLQLAMFEDKVWQETGRSVNSD